MSELGLNASLSGANGPVLEHWPDFAAQRKDNRYFLVGKVPHKAKEGPIYLQSQQLSERAMETNIRYCNAISSLSGTNRCFAAVDSSKAGNRRRTREEGHSARRHRAGDGRARRQDMGGRIRAGRILRPY